MNNYKNIPLDKLYVLLLIIMLGLTIFLSLNRYHAIAEARESLQLAEQTLSLEHIQLRQLLDLKDEGPRLQQRLELFNILFPEKSTPFEIELYLYELAYLSGLTQFDVRFEVIENFDDYEELPLSLSLESSFHNLLQFMEALKQGERVFRVDSLDLYPVNSGSGRLNGYIKLSTFCR